MHVNLRRLMKKQKALLQKKNQVNDWADLQRLKAAQMKVLKKEQAHVVEQAKVEKEFPLRKTEGANLVALKEAQFALKRAQFDHAVNVLHQFALKVPLDTVKPTPEKRHTFLNGSSFGEALKKRGYENLGGGYFSTVYGKKGSDRVIKVGRRIDSDGWPEYIYWAAKRGYAGTFAPKVHSFKIIQGKEEKFYIASMERLPKTFNDIGSDHGAILLPSLLDYGLFGKNETAMTLLDLLHPGFNKFVMDMKSWRESNRPKEGHKLLDLHTGNWMLRDKNIPVIVDAFGYNSKKTEFKRLKAGDFTSLAQATLH